MAHPFDPAKCVGCSVFGDPTKRFGVTKDELSSLRACSSPGEWNRAVDAILDAHTQTVATSSGKPKLKPVFPSDFWEKVHGSGLSAKVLRKT